ncbi:hypothetical protein CQW23_34537 [Capsicum baccatum]|uniref:Protein TAR1 n=1 Tax=Capsicum baccatum TaxID=33114 RepID=A0A2G2UYM9_CAPBA|nr:hypothetical protein CQW23_34537 [Capsicum baccatum]
MVPRRLGAKVPRRLGATVAWHHGALVPWCPGAMAPRCQAALVPWCHGAGIQGERDRHLQGVSELAVQRAGSISSSPPTAYVFGTGTPVPSPQSQSFSRSYGSILPTFLAYIVPSTRGCSPWRPDAVMSTTGHGRNSVLRIFKGRRERTEHHATCGALPAAGPYLRLSRFQGGQAVKQKIQLFPRLPPTSPDFLTLPSTAPSRHSSPSFGSRQVCSHSNPSQKIKVDRRCTPRGDPTNQLRCALRVYSPVDSHTCQTPWSVFEDRSNGEPTGQRPERADTEARQRRALPATIEETAFHERIEIPGFGRPLIHAGPRPESIGGMAHRRSTSFSGRIAGPHPLPSRQFQALFDSLFKVLFIFPSRVRAQRGSHPLRRPLPGDLRPRVIPPDLGSRSERLSAKGSWSPNARRAVAAATKRVELQPPLAATCDVHRRGLAFRPAASARHTRAQYPPRDDSAPHD